MRTHAGLCRTLLELRMLLTSDLTSHIPAFANCRDWTFSAPFHPVQHEFRQLVRNWEGSILPEPADFQIQRMQHGKFKRYFSRPQLRMERTCNPVSKSRLWTWRWRAQTFFLLSFRSGFCGTRSATVVPRVEDGPSSVVNHPVYVT